MKNLVFRLSLLFLVIVLSGCTNTEESKTKTTPISETSAPEVVETEFKAADPKFQLLWKDFAMLTNDELVSDYKILTDPKKNIPECNSYSPGAVGDGKDKVYIPSFGNWVCRNPKGGYGYSVEAPFRANMEQDSPSSTSNGGGILLVKDVAPQIKLYLNQNRKINVDK